MDTSQYEQNVPFPPANFDSWPITRIGALTIDALLLIVVLLLWFIPRRVYNLNTVPDDEDEPAYCLRSQFKLWGFWVCGLDTVKMENGQATITQRRACGFCSRKEVTVPLNALSGIRIMKRRLWPYGIIWAFFISCVIGIWLHFIPCIAWTCDWGYFDGQGFRGAIWFISWGIFFIVLLLMYRTVYIQMSVTTIAGTEPITYDLSAGDGQCWDIGDAAALWELGEVRKGLYSSGESKKFYYHF